VRTARALLSADLARLPPLAAPPAAQGARAPARDGAAGAALHGRRPPPVARVATARPDSPAVARPCGVHGARSPAEALGVGPRALARPVRALPARRRP